MATNKKNSPAKKAAPAKAEKKEAKQAKAQQRCGGGRSGATVK